MPTVSFIGTSASSGGPGDVDWSGVSGAYGTDVSTAAVCSPVIGTQETFVISVAGFASNLIPNGATILGISVGANAWYGFDIPTTDALVVGLGYHVGTHSGSALGGTSLSTTVGSLITAGGPSSFPPGLSGVTAAELNDGTSIVVSFQAQGGSGGTQYTIKVAGMGMTVTYAAGSTDPFPAGYEQSQVGQGPQHLFWPHLAMRAHAILARVVKVRLRPALG